MPDLRVVVAACRSLALVGCGRAGGPEPDDPVTGGTSASTPVGPSPTSGRTSSQPRPAPARLVIPEIALDERLIGLGLAPDGAMEVPEDPDRVGWFTGGGRPGGHGPTVLAGHVDSTEGPAAFGELTELEVGDEIHVDDGEGRRVAYRVDRLTDHPKGEFPTEEVFGATPADELRLITCGGDWDSVASQYSDNHVVHASAVTR